MDLEDLPGVGPAIAEKLRDAGLNTLESVAVASPGEIGGNCGDRRGDSG